MKTFLSLMIAALFPFVKCTSSCECPAPENILLGDSNFLLFRNPWRFLQSAERLYLKYMPHLKDFDNINCIISDLITNDSTSGSVERNVSWTILSETAERDFINVELEKSYKSYSEFTASEVDGHRSWDFNTVYVDTKCLIVKLSQTLTGKTRLCLLWVKEKYLENPLRHCRFLYDVFCSWNRDDLRPTKDCDKGVGKKVTRPTKAENQSFWYPSTSQDSKLFKENGISRD
uniref:Putative salivary lipocalin n=1 Tax=Ixodes ricinus TaxID=34613 RepID=A0A0K8R7X9_IXORI